MSFAISLAHNKVEGMEFGREQRTRFHRAAASGSPSLSSAFGLVTGVPDGRLVHSHPTTTPVEFAQEPEHFVALALGSPDFQHK
jgi:hypothetical protein